MSWRRAAALGLCGLLLTPAMARAAPPREPFDPARSAAAFTVELRVAGPVDGRFARVDGELVPAGGDLWRVQVRVDARELQVDGPAWMLRATRSDKFLDVDRHPEILFTSLPFHRDLLRRGGDLAGDLRLRGRTRPTIFRIDPAACATPGRGCDIHVIGAVNRRDFGMTAQKLWLRDTVGFDFRVRLRDAGRR